MNDAQRSACCFRFGAFEFNPQIGELLKHGLKIKLSGQPVEVLAILLERPGQRVTREELQKRLWPNDTVVEFEHSINAGINRLREALGDSANEPRYVETLPRRGYRFIAPVEVIAPPQTAAPVVEPVSAEVPAASEPRSLEAPLEEAAEEASADLAGQTVSHYRVLERIGSGAMGVIYRAEDTRLGRMVALKFLPAELAQDRQALARFQREARAASALNHPNICTVYDIDEHAGRPFIAMELLEGETLKERLTVGARHGVPLQINALLDLAFQIAAGLEAAHGKGIIHRDIKPANIFLTTQGQAKILDFGVAKLTRGTGIMPVAGSEPEEGARATAGPTRTTDDTLTQPGSPIGTAAYMSPEQVRAEALDTRTDIFSFGAVLYEMATGRQAFAGGTSSEVQQAILTQPPVSPKSLHPDLPSKLEEIIHKALEKDRELRYQHASDMRAELQRLKRDTDSGRSAAAISVGSAGPSSAAGPSGLASTVVSQPGRPRWKVRAVAVGGLGLVLIALLIYFQSRPLPPPKVSGYVPVTHNGSEKDLVGTDGARLYFNEYAEGFATGIAQVLGSGGEVARVPVPAPTMQVLAVSPDGATLLVADEVGTALKGPLWAVPVLGGSRRRLGEAVGGAAAWSPDGQKIVYANGHDLFLAKSDGAEPHKLVSAPDPVLDLAWSPDGIVIRFSAGLLWNQSSLWQVSINGTGLHPLFPAWHTPPDECCGKWTPDGKYFVFESQGNVWALAEKGNLLGKASGQPWQLTSGPMTFDWPLPSKDGKDLFVVGALARGELVRYDAKSAEFVPFLSGISATEVSFSRDGQWVAYVSLPEQTLWTSKLDGSQRLQLSYPPLRASWPRWSPDGKQIAFVGIPPGQKAKMCTVSTDGGTPREMIPEDTENQWDPNWSPDGTRIVFGGAYYDPSPTIRILDVKTRQISTVPGSKGLFSPRWSPDGRYVKAQTCDSHSCMLFDFTTQRWEEIAKVPGGYAAWSRTGDYVYFLRWDGPRSVMRVRIRDRKVEHVADLGHAGRFLLDLGLAPDDSPLLTRDTGTQEIYALDWQAP